MEEQRARQEAEQRTAAATSAQTTDGVSAPSVVPATADEQMLGRALTSSIQGEPDFSTMTEEEQIQYAMQMSLQQQAVPG